MEDWGFDYTSVDPDEIIDEGWAVPSARGINNGIVYNGEEAWEEYTPCPCGKGQIAQKYFWDEDYVEGCEWDETNPGPKKILCKECAKKYKVVNGEDIVPKGTKVLKRNEKRYTHVYDEHTGNLIDLSTGEFVNVL